MPLKLRTMISKQSVGEIENEKKDEWAQVEMIGGRDEADRISSVPESIWPEKTNERGAAKNLALAKLFGPFCLSRRAVAPEGRGVIEGSLKRKLGAGGRAEVAQLSAAAGRRGQGAAESGKGGRRGA